MRTKLVRVLHSTSAFAYLSVVIPEEPALSEVEWGVFLCLALTFAPFAFFLASFAFVFALDSNQLQVSH